MSLQDSKTGVGSPQNQDPVSKKKEVVYSIPCAECHWTCIGETGRSLNIRLQEHFQALKNRDISAFAIAEHVFEAGYQVVLSKATVTDCHPTPRPTESWHIHHQAPLNRE